MDAYWSYSYLNLTLLAKRQAIRKVKGEGGGGGRVSAIHGFFSSSIGVCMFSCCDIYFFFHLLAVWSFYIRFACMDFFCYLS